MQFTPKTEQEIREMMMLPDGEYDFEVKEAEDTTSKKKGNEMIALNLAVFDSDGSQTYVRDWLVNSDAALSQMKILHFCEATGMIETYRNGTLNALACEGLAGRVLIGHREQDGYPPQNVVLDYEKSSDGSMEVVMGVPAAQTKAANKAADLRASTSDMPEDECPF